MGFAVFHLEKASGNNAAMSAHNERTIEPKNVDKTRTHLNRELIQFHDSVNTRTEAIQHRIETAGITRKISHNQVCAIRIMLSGMYEDMKQLENEGKFNDWCADNVDWLKITLAQKTLFPQYCISTKKRLTFTQLLYRLLQTNGAKPSGNSKAQKRSTKRNRPMPFACAPMI